MGWVPLLLFLFINIFFSCFTSDSTYLFQGVPNICNTDTSNPNCNQPTEYECTALSQTESKTICGCSSPIKASVIIIIDASNHTKDEWKYITLKWLELYYKSIYSLHSNDIQIYYMLSHGDFTLTSLNQDPLNSELASDSFMNNLNELSIPNACVAFKKANEFLLNDLENYNKNDTSIIYYAKSTPFAPSFTYHCAQEDIHHPNQLINNKDIFSIKYHQDITLNYVQRDIGEFAYEMSIFPNIYNNKLIDIKTDDYLYENGTRNEISASIVAAISDFICTKGKREDICTLPLDTGQSCESDNETKYYFDNNECIGFNYIGCGGNENRFNTKIECDINCSENEFNENDCCVYASGIKYSDIEICDISLINNIENYLYNNNCLYYCNPYEYYIEPNEHNWNCIANYSLYVQLYHICIDDDDNDNDNVINESIWNNYRWHCPQCYNNNINEYKTLCKSNNGHETLLDIYIEDNCDCKDITVFLVVIIEIIALLVILIGTFVLWYRYNVWKIKMHERRMQFEAINGALNNPHEIILNDISDITDIESDIE